MTKLRLMAVAFVALLLAACSAGRIDEVKAEQCPAINVLATADSWIMADVEIRMTGAHLTCFVDQDSDQLQAAVMLTGTTTKTGVAVPFFLATLNAQDRVVNRTQYKVSVSQSPFTFSLPSYVYGSRGDTLAKPRLVAGFVLTKEQLQANRERYRKRLRLD